MTENGGIIIITIKIVQNNSKTIIYSWSVDEVLNGEKSRGVFMLMEQRFREILKAVEEKQSVTVQELTELLHTSESTIRRDLSILDKEGKLNKVHGGATAVGQYAVKDEDVALRMGQNREEKLEIVKYAAALILPEDFVYLDAGTTTELMIDFITERNAVYVTNGISHAKKLVQKGCEAHILGGKIKLSTEAVVGNETISELDKYNFTLGFFGTNGISVKRGFSTPDIDEAMVKKKAMEQCRQCYILADSSKFNQISAIRFADFKAADIITSNVKAGEFAGYENIREVKKA